MARRTPDRHLLDALSRAYMARAKLFHNGLRASRIDLLFAEIDAIDGGPLDWTDATLGVSASALQRVRDTGGSPHQVFAHPDVIAQHPHLIAYYRNVVTISKKGIAQMLWPTNGYEAKKRTTMDRDLAVTLCRTLNQILSGVIDETPGYDVQLSRQAVLAEIGTELQGAWANTVGQGAAREVERMFAGYLDEHEWGRDDGAHTYTLRNGWRIVFSNEPDVAFFDAAGVKQIAIEIKGSLDTAGAQTRYGEAKKSFAKQLQENPRCHTVYLASCFTDAVIRQIRSDGQVREWFNLTSILYDEEERRRFLQRVFHIVSTPA